MSPVLRYSLLACLLLLGACAQNPPAPVVDLTRPIPALGEAEPGDGGGMVAEVIPQSGKYIVQPGDTLYSIAFRYQLGWEDLAWWNGVAAPYVIAPGQELRLTPPPPGERGSTVATFGLEDSVAVVKSATVKPAVPSAATAESADKAEDSVMLATTIEPPPKEVDAAGKKVEPRATRRVDGIAWQWPAGGKIIRNYDGSNPQRLDIVIAGERDEPVHAVADGVVLFSGDGIKGYGRLVIIAHANDYISAYGHNRKLLVEEDDKVRAGEKIAIMGASDARRVELYLQMRKRGKPVNPLKYLPQR